MHDAGGKNPSTTTEDIAAAAWTVALLSNSSSNVSGGGAPPMAVQGASEPTFPQLASPIFLMAMSALPEGVAGSTDSALTGWDLESPRKERRWLGPWRWKD